MSLYAWIVTFVRWGHHLCTLGSSPLYAGVITFVRLHRHPCALGSSPLYAARTELGRWDGRSCSLGSLSLSAGPIACARWTIDPTPRSTFVWSAGRTLLASTPSSIGLLTSSEMRAEPSHDTSRQHGRHTRDKPRGPAMQWSHASDRARSCQRSRAGMPGEQYRQTERIIRACRPTSRTIPAISVDQTKRARRSPRRTPPC
jgi:hypothetical protein